MKLPQGFVGAACAAGLKSTGASDLTLIENTGPPFLVLRSLHQTKLLQLQLSGVAK
jgi:hypothetical protein